MKYSGCWGKPTKIKTATEDADGVMLSLESSSVFFMKKKDYKGKCSPKAGDTIRVNLRISTISGVELNGEIIFLKSDEQLEEEHKQMVEKMKADRKVKYEKNKDDLARRIAAMPEPFRKRFGRFSSRKPDFMEENGGYEVFTCEQAVAFAETLKTVEAIEAFRNMDYDQQRKAVPSMSDGHSGNTFGFACALASTYLREPRAVPFFHATSAIITGCEEAGCHPLTDEEKAFVESWGKET